MKKIPKTTKSQEISIDNINDDNIDIEIDVGSLNMSPIPSSQKTKKTKKSNLIEKKKRKKRRKKRRRRQNAQ